MSILFPTSLSPFAIALSRRGGAIGCGAMVALLAWSGAAASQAPPAPVPTVETPLQVRRPLLRPGSQGDPVVELQAMLRLLGYYTGAVDGRYQDGTAQAVIAFQQAAGLPADGIVGGNTWALLLPATAPEAPAPASPAPAPPTAAPPAAPSAAVELPVLRLGMRGSAVARLQERLRAAGFFDGAIDGIFGTETQAAVQAAQRSYRLTPDGIVGSATWSALLRSP